ncbi:beta clamp domain-containing protein [Nocardiopsis halophila]|uniref:hypothetical protein n=1 Tax=Nocardiopsis halophila TaxID=141692 RepID=UPI000344941B|nr:hypothetical protein [Nocardiopsis halophila]
MDTAEAAPPQDARATATVGALHLALGAVAPHRAEEDSGVHHVLGGIRLEAAGGGLVAVATDRHTLAAARVDNAETTGDLALTLTPDAADRMLWTLGRLARIDADSPAELSLEGDGRLRVYYRTPTPPGVTSVLDTIAPHRWPDWRALFAPTPAEAGAQVLIRPDHAARLDVPLLRGRGGVRITACGRQTASPELPGHYLVTSGDDFAAIVAPTRQNAEPTAGALEPEQTIERLIGT